MVCVPEVILPASLHNVYDRAVLISVIPIRRTSSLWHRYIGAARAWHRIFWGRQVIITVSMRIVNLINVWSSLIRARFYTFTIDTDSREGVKPKGVAPVQKSAERGDSKYLALSHACHSKCLPISKLSSQQMNFTFLTSPFLLFTAAHPRFPLPHPLHWTRVHFVAFLKSEFKKCTKTDHVGVLFFNSHFAYFTPNKHVTEWEHCNSGHSFYHSVNTLAVKTFSFPVFLQNIIQSRVPKDLDSSNTTLPLYHCTFATSVVVHNTISITFLLMIQLSSFFRCRSYQERR